MSKFALIVFVFSIIGCNPSFQFPSLATRIVGGQDANIEDVPYQLSLWHSNEFLGGASIIHVKWAITAAHCVSGKNFIDKNFRVGAGNISKNDGTFYKILKVIEHKLYNKQTADNDIALLQIDGGFKFGTYVKAVDLPESNFEPNSGLEVTVSGWGRTEAQNLKFLNAMDSEKLKKVTVPIVDRKDCAKKYKNVQRITKNMICAGDLQQGGKDACINDSGGPMVASNKLYGIVSWGRGCGSKIYPGVYTHVAKYVNWIKENM